MVFDSVHGGVNYGNGFIILKCCDAYNSLHEVKSISFSMERYFPYENQLRLMISICERALALHKNSYNLNHLTCWNLMVEPEEQGFIFTEMSNTRLPIAKLFTVTAKTRGLTHFIDYHREFADRATSND